MKEIKLTMERAAQWFRVDAGTGGYTVDTDKHYTPLKQKFLEQHYGEEAIEFALNTDFSEMLSHVQNNIADKVAYCSQRFRTRVTQNELLPDETAHTLQPYINTKFKTSYIYGGKAETVLKFLRGNSKHELIAHLRNGVAVGVLGSIAQMPDLQSSIQYVVYGAIMGYTTSVLIGDIPTTTHLTNYGINLDQRCESLQKELRELYSTEVQE